METEEKYGGSPFRLVAPYGPTGDQPQAIDALVRGLRGGRRFQTLEGVTGSGKTFTLANVIAQYGRPTLVMSHNKTLAAQLYAELKSFFPHNAVEYFVSYYDFYQPEAYIPTTDTYIEKDASINEGIERLRLAATDALLNREDVILVASVSCIYGLGSPEDYREMTLRLVQNGEMDRDQMLEKLVAIQYGRNDLSSESGTFRVRGDTVDIFPAYTEQGLRVNFFGNTVEKLQRIEPLTGRVLAEPASATVSPARHFVMPHQKIGGALTAIRDEMNARVSELIAANKLVEAQRLKMRTECDLELLREIGVCNGIENYSRHLAGRAAGERPACLLDYLPQRFLTVLDESHVTLPQIRGMFNGDQARKKVLVKHGFRLPSALDNRPLRLEEFLALTGPMLFLSATPGPFELGESGAPARQIIRPTGILDPVVEVRPLKNQIDDVMEEIRACAGRGERVLVTTLTKKTAEDLSAYLKDTGLRVKYLHSDIDAIARVGILRGLRKADFDCLVGINLLREGLDLPEVSLVAILDADKEGFLRSETSLIQTAGRAARHIRGRVVMYADQITGAMRRMMDVTGERRAIQEEYNRTHGITPQAIEKAIHDELVVVEDARKAEQQAVCEDGVAYDVTETLRQMEEEMLEAANRLEFERAAILRDQIRELTAAQTGEKNATPSRRKNKSYPQARAQRR